MYAPSAVAFAVLGPSGVSTSMAAPGHRLVRPEAVEEQSQSAVPRDGDEFEGIRNGLTARGDGLRDRRRGRTWSCPSWACAGPARTAASSATTP